LFCNVDVFGADVLRDANWSSIMVPYGADQTVYLVVDHVHAGAGAIRDAELERIDLETIIGDLMSGQFNDPVRVVAFNTLEHWTKDVSGVVAAEIQSRCDIDGEPVPEHIAEFIERHAAPLRSPADRQALRGDHRATYGRRQRRRASI
jgi:hypothetical protein